MKPIFFLLLLISYHSLYSQQLPKEFVYLSDIAPTIQTELRYFSTKNFIGIPVNGYHNNCVLITEKAAIALKRIQQSLAKQNLGLKIFDAYRPQEAVNHFVRWAKKLDDTLMKNEYYPRVSKSALFKQGYISSKSGHTRGSSVDLTIINTHTGKELDMGSPYDFFGKESHLSYKNITPNQIKNRLFLRKVMIDNGFRPYKYEWWHFTLRNEPFPKTYFKFPIE